MNMIYVIYKVKLKMYGDVHVNVPKFGYVQSLQFMMQQICLESELARTSVLKRPVDIRQHDNIIQ